MQVAESGRLESGVLNLELLAEVSKPFGVKGQNRFCGTRAHVLPNQFCGAATRKVAKLLAASQSVRRFDERRVSNLLSNCDIAADPNRFCDTRKVPKLLGCTVQYQVANLSSGKVPDGVPDRVSDCQRGCLPNRLPYRRTAKPLECQRCRGILRHSRT